MADIETLIAGMVKGEFMYWSSALPAEIPHQLTEEQTTALYQALGVYIMKSVTEDSKTRRKTCQRFNKTEIADPTELKRLLAEFDRLSPEDQIKNIQDTVDRCMRLNAMYPDIWRAFDQNREYHQDGYLRSVVSVLTETQREEVADYLRQRGFISG